MNSLTKHKISALKYAHNAIRTGEAEFVCHALDSFSDLSKEYEYAAEYLIKYIEEVLEGHHTLTGWTAKQIKKDTDKIARTPKMKRTRLAWIDWMIACYEGNVK